MTEDNSPFGGQSAAVPDEALDTFKEVLLHTNDMEWIEKSLDGLSHKTLWRDEETEASITLVRFEKGSGIPSPHVHASNQFMFCLEGRYRYVPTDKVLEPGDFYWNPKGSTHGPTHADETSVLLEVYDGPHYPEMPSWYTREEDAR